MQPIDMNAFQRVQNSLSNLRSVASSGAAIDITSDIGMLDSYRHDDGTGHNGYANRTLRPAGQLMGLDCGVVAQLEGEHDPTGYHTSLSFSPEGSFTLQHESSSATEPAAGEERNQFQGSVTGSDPLSQVYQQRAKLAGLDGQAGDVDGRRFYIDEKQPDGTRLQAVVDPTWLPGTRFDGAQGAYASRTLGVDGKPTAFETGFFGVNPQFPWIAVERQQASLGSNGQFTGSIDLQVLDPRPGHADEPSHGALVASQIADLQKQVDSLLPSR